MVKRRLSFVPNRAYKNDVKRDRRVSAMVTQAQVEGFGACTNVGECEAVCPKEIKLEVIARMNRDFLHASITGRGDT